MTKILILNFGNGLNKGNLALLYSAVNLIKKYVSNPEFVIMYYSDSDSHSNITLSEKPVLGIISKRKIKYTILSSVYLLRCFYIYIFSKFKLNISISKESRLFDYYDSDMVIVIGGDTMSGDYGLKILTPFLNIFYCLLLNKDVILFGESIGYYKKQELGFIAKFIFNRTKLILLRDELSMKYASKNINCPHIYQTADLAFLLNPSSQSRIYEILSAEDIDEIKRPLIGINASSLIKKYSEKELQNGEDNLVNMIAKVIDDLIENLNAYIIMIPHVYEFGNDDRVTISYIFDKVKNKSKVSIIKNEYSPQELKGIIGICDLFIGGRMHSTIASTSMLVPTVGIAYSHKMYGIIGKMLGQEAYIIDIKDLTYNNLVSTIYNAWENKTTIKSELELKIPLVKKRAILNGEYLNEYLNHLRPAH
jgi:polysaccharide pyruvyl transferase WcaK-like protein